MNTAMHASNPMNPLRCATRLAGIAGIAVLFAATIATTATAAESAISVAEQKVFLDDHLRTVGPSGVLRYRYTRTGTLEKGIDDHVALTIRPKGATRSVEVAYLSGERRVTLPPLDDAKANPVILYFLEQDVRDMHRRLGGSENYFRRRIRLAFAETADVHPTTAMVDGREVAATEVVIRPFVDDPMKERLGPSQNKSYAFVLSDRVAGGIVRLRSRVENDAARDGPVPTGGTPLIEDELSFDPRAK